MFSRRPVLRLNQIRFLRRLAVAIMALTGMCSVAMAQATAGAAIRLPSGTLLTVWAATLALASAAGFAWRGVRTRDSRPSCQPAPNRRATNGNDYAQLSLSANDVVLLMDERGRILDANDRAVEMYGYSREEMLAMEIRDLRHPDEKATLIRHWNEVE